MAMLTVSSDYRDVVPYKLFRSDQTVNKKHSLNFGEGDEDNVIDFEE